MGAFPNFCLAAFIFAFFSLSGGEIRIGITHWNDVSGQLPSFKMGTSNSSAAPEECSTGGDCIGGFVNMVHWIHDDALFNASEVQPENILRLSSGNLIGGESGWLSSIKNLTEDNSWGRFGRAVCDHFSPSVTALGMKEFGAGVPRTVDYIKADASATTACFKVALANACENSEGSPLCPLIEHIQIIEVKSKDGTETLSIGVIGFVTPTVMNLSLPGDLTFSPIVESVKKQVSNNSNINTFIAIGDGSLATSQQILDEIPEVKLVIYGMGLGNSKDMTGDYPMKYGGQRYIATAGRYGSSVGKLVFDIDTNSGLLNLRNQSLQVTSKPDGGYNSHATSALVTFGELENDVNAEKNDPVGRTRVLLLGGEPCWRKECNLGNLVADAMVHCTLQDDALPHSFPLHAIWHGGALFEEVVTAGSEIFKFDVHKWLPYHNLAHLVTMKGDELREVFQVSATGIDPEGAGTKDWRQFLQVSNGFEVHYDTRNDGGPKLTRLRMAHDDGGIPKFDDLQDNTTYYLVIPTFLYEGRGLYGFTKGLWKDVDGSKPVFDDNCVERYIKAMGQVSIGLEERIFIDEDPTPPGTTPPPPPECDKCKGSNTAVTVILTLVFFIIFLAVIYVGYFFVLPRLRRAPEVYPPNQL